MSILIGDQYFAQNPDKVLGTEKETSGPFGPELRVQGSLEDALSMIDTPPPSQWGNFVVSETGLSPKVQKIVNQAVRTSVVKGPAEKAKRTKKRKVRAKKTGKKITPKDEAHPINDPEFGYVYSVGEVIDMYNGDITPLEWAAFLFANPDTIFSRHVKAPKLSKEALVEKGVLFHRAGKYYYKWQYLTGNVYDLYADLANDKEFVIEQYGRGVFDRQNALLDEYTPSKKKLRTDVKDLRISLVPHDRVFAGITIQKLDSLSFPVPRPLKTAFTLWLQHINRESPNELAPSNVGDILKVFINNKNPSDDDVPNSSNASKDQLAVGKANIQRDAKAAGQKLFDRFLAYEIPDELRIEIEAGWNRQYNSFLTLNTDKIPVAFTLGKYFDDDKTLRLLHAQRDGVAFTQDRGSAMLAYDVGVGKTITSLAAFSAFAEQGRATRALFSVPTNTYNQWLLSSKGGYDQFGNYVRGVLPHYNVLDWRQISLDTIRGQIKAYSDEEEDVLRVMEGGGGYLEKSFKEWTDEPLVLTKEQEKTEKTVWITKLRSRYKVSEAEQSSEADTVVTNVPLWIETKAIESKSLIRIVEFCQDLAGFIPVLKRLGHIGRSDSHGDDVERVLKAAKNVASIFGQIKRETYFEAGFEVVPFEGIWKAVGILRSFVRLYSEMWTWMVYNLGSIKPIPEKSIILVTYEGMMRLGYNKQTRDKQQARLFNILSQGEDDPRAAAKLEERVDEMMSSTLLRPQLSMEEIGVDYFVVDEAHNMKNLFTTVKGDVKEGLDKDAGPGEYRSAYRKDYRRQRESESYALQGGPMSSRALKTFLHTSYINHIKGDSNVLLLTATPFTNSPLEIFSQMAHIGYEWLDKKGLGSLKGFFDTFIKEETRLKVNQAGELIHAPEIVGFKNLAQLKAIIYERVDYKTGEDANVIRPCKVVLPLKTPELAKKATEEACRMLPPHPQGKPFEPIDTILIPTDLQEEIMGKVRDYMTAPVETPTEKAIRQLKGMDMLRKVAISPHLLIHAVGSKIEEESRVLWAYFDALEGAIPFPTPEEFIESSPKLKYIVNCIISSQQYDLAQEREPSGQIIYMNLGTAYMGMIKAYLSLPPDIRTVNGQKRNYGGVGAFLPTEIAIVSGSTHSYNPKDGSLSAKPKALSAKAKEKVKQGFNNGAIKVVIGSASIKEGISLQKRATALYVAHMDWNPTDNKQVEGRGWRQGNPYQYFRIVYTLLADSLDVFIFQKLKEKTQRIKQLLDRHNKVSQFELDEFDPEALLLAMITDPEKRAEIAVIQERQILSAEVILTRSHIQELEKAERKVSSYKTGRLSGISILNEYQTLRKLYDKNGDIEDAKAKAERAKARDEEAPKMYDFEADPDGLYTPLVYSDESDGKISRALNDMINFVARRQDAPEFRDLFAGDRWRQIGLTYANFRDTYKEVERISKKLAEPRGLTIDQFADLQLKLQKELAEKEDRLSKVKERKRELFDKFKAEREEDILNRASLEDRVREFSQLNYLLDHCRKSKGGAKQRKPLPKPVPEYKVPALVNEGARVLSPSAILKEKFGNALKLMPKRQVAYVKEALKGDGEEMMSILADVEKMAKAIPSRQASADDKDDLIVYAHFFVNPGQGDWYVIDWHRGDGRLFAWADLGYGELGYVSVDELRQSNNVELDFYWTPRKLGSILRGDMSIVEEAELVEPELPGELAAPLAALFEEGASLESLGIDEDKAIHVLPSSQEPEKSPSEAAPPTEPEDEYLYLIQIKTKTAKAKLRIRKRRKAKEVA